MCTASAVPGGQGAKGKAFTFVTKADEEAIENIEKLIGNKIVSPRQGRGTCSRKKTKRLRPSAAVRRQLPRKRREKPVEAKAPRTEKPVAEKPVRAKSEPKPAPEAVVGDEGWNGPMPGFLSVGFGS